MFMVNGCFLGLVIMNEMIADLCQCDDLVGKGSVLILEKAIVRLLP